MSFEDEEDEEPKEQEEEDKQKQFSQYSEAYYSTLHVCLFPLYLLRPYLTNQLNSQDIQVSLRTSIRHLRLSRASPAPLLDPFFGSLATPGGGGVAVGGVGMGESLASGELGEGVGEDSGVGAGTREEGKREGREERKEEKKGASVAALGLEMEAWKELGRALSAGEEGVNEET